MIKIKFNKLPITTFDGQTRDEQWAENIGNLFFRYANNFQEFDLGEKIFHEGPDGTELNDKELALLKTKIPELRYFLQIALKKVIAEQEQPKQA